MWESNSKKKSKNCTKKLIEPTSEMAQSSENYDSRQHTLDSNDCDDDGVNDKKANESVDDVRHLKFETTVVSSPKPIGWMSVQPQSQQQHQTVTVVTSQRNGHSRNPSSINGITIATQVIQPPPNKPDAIQNLLKLIRFRSDYDESDEKSKNRQICGIREARLFSKCLVSFSFPSKHLQFVNSSSESQNHPLSNASGFIAFARGEM